MISDKLSERLGQPVVIINRPGANSEIGYRDVAAARPDGYTMVLTVPSLVSNTFYLRGSLDPGQLTPVAYLAEGPYILLASGKFGATSIADVVDKIKASPGNVSCALTGGVGSIGCEMLEALTKTKLLKVAYTGSNPGTLAVMAGDVDLAFNFSITAQIGAQMGVQAEQVRPIATTAPKRGGPPFPDLPAMNEVIPGFELAGWHGVMVPDGTPKDIVARLNQEINAVLKMPDIKEKLAKGGLEPVGGTPEDFAVRLDKVRTTFGKVLAENGTKAE